MNLKHKINILFLVILVLIGGLIISRQMTYAYLTSLFEIKNNTIAVGTWATPTPTSAPSLTPTLIPTLTPTVSPTPAISSGDVVINEIMWMGSQGDSADEWIELRNMTGSPIDLSNWVITDIGPGSADITIPSGKTISGNGFFVIANDTEPNSVMSIVPDHIVNLSMNDTGEQIILKNSSDITIDIADNAGGGWFAGANPGGQNPKSSMERNSIPGDGTVSTNWHTATTQVNIDAEAEELATPRAVND